MDWWGFFKNGGWIFALFLVLMIAALHRPDMTYNEETGFIDKVYGK